MYTFVYISISFISLSLGVVSAIESKGLARVAEVAFFGLTCSGSVYVAIKEWKLVWE